MNTSQFYVYLSMLYFGLDLNSFMFWKLFTQFGVMFHNYIVKLCRPYILSRHFCDGDIIVPCSLYCVLTWIMSDVFDHIKYIFCEVKTEV